MKSIVAGIVALLLSTVSVISAPIEQSSSFVKVVTARGYGSGTYIGNGYFLTANHVVKDEDTLQVKLEDGTMLPVELVTDNALLDMAILHIVGPKMVNLEPVNIKCGVPAVGTHVTMHGNPAGDYNELEFVYTQGEVVGKPVNLANIWFNAIPVDGTIIWGMSGGAATDNDGNLVGINVATHIANRQSVGISYIIPTQLICNQITFEGIDLT